jgi:hypothetical protein
VEKPAQDLKQEFLNELARMYRAMSNSLPLIRALSESLAQHMDREAWNELTYPISSGEFDTAYWMVEDVLEKHGVPKQ